jgi:hypothetical protein
VSPNDRSIDRKQLPVDLAAVHLARLQMPQNALPEATPRPRPKAIVYALPGPKLRGDIAPSAAVGQRPKDRIDHHPMILPLATALAIFRQQPLDLLPLARLLVR